MQTKYLIDFLKSYLSIFLYFSGQSCICICIWDSSAPYIHICFSYLSCPLLLIYLGFGKNKGKKTIIITILKTKISLSFCFCFCCLAHLCGLINGLLVWLRQMKKWKAWENETKTIEYQYYNGK